MSITTTHAPDFTKIMRRAVGLAVAAVTAAALLLGLLAGALGEGAPEQAQPTSAPAAVPSSAPAVAPAVPSEPAAPSVEAPTTRTVASGDTLAGIAQRTGVPVELLAADNGVDDPDRITAGQVLTVATPPSDVVVVTEGATLGGYAQQHATSVDRLLELNPQIADPDRILAGAGLRIAS
ncbi:LysM peptidoglycan-binding domain-containing protein [Actinomycetospora sp. CA-053990]|uniref:LysM peptidoglycan-binding domain-containing protein n=1 Tax=Actinomycetospora sp. CA-053990 TaxID=3239891 RepID=UPI003D918A75